MSCMLFSNIFKLDELVIGGKRTTATETISGWLEGEFFQLRLYFKNETLQ